VSERAKVALRSVTRSEKLGLLIALAAMVIFFQTQNSNYLIIDNLINILVSMSIVGLVAIGETYLMIGGAIDLSPGSVSAFSGVLAALLLKQGWGTFTVIPVVVAVGALIGYFNATLVNRLKLGYFIATLATMSIFRGLAYIICDGKAIFITNQAFISIGIIRIFGIPLPSIIFLVFISVFSVILARTRFGRSIYMMGGNPTAAFLAGFNQEKRLSVLYMLSGSLAALGGTVLASRMNSGQPMASQGLEFDAITAAVLGGVAMRGGIGTMGGCMIGLLIMLGFNNGLQVLNVQSFWQQVCKGLLLIAALAFDYLRRVQREKSLEKSQREVMEEDK